MSGDVGLVHQHDRRAVVARLGQELPGLGGIARELVLPAPRRLQRRAAGEQRLALLVELGIADIGVEEILLVQRIEHGLPDLGIVERLVQHVEAHRVLAAGLVHDLDLDALLLLDQRQQIGRHDLDEIDLVVQQRIDLRLRVGDPDPFDAIDLRHLAAGKAGRRLGARLVVGVLQVDRLLAGLPLVLLEDERARPRGVGDLRIGIGVGDALGHHERHVGAGLAQRVEHEPVRLLQHHPDRLVVGRRQLGDIGHQLLAHRVLGAPALERGDAVGGRHRRAVVPGEPVTQGERPGKLVGRGVPLLHHLRLELQLVVEGKQRVVDEIAVVLGDQRRGPDRIDDLEVRMKRELERGLLREGGGGKWNHRSRGKRADETTTDSQHENSLGIPCKDQE